MQTNSRLDEIVREIEKILKLTKTVPYHVIVPYIFVMFIIIYILKCSQSTVMTDFN